MRCKKVLERLDDHVDGLLAAPEAEAIRAHLDLCTECRETSFALSAATASLSSWNDTELPSDCFDKILARIDALPPEALAHAAPRGFLARLPRFETIRAARIRWMATSGMAAAAAVLSAALLSQVEQRPVRRLKLAPAPNSVVTDTGSWFQGYDWDNGLNYQRSRRPMLQPVRSGARLGRYEVSPR
jgi:anti-sigma factor RsiW